MSFVTCLDTNLWFQWPLRNRCFFLFSFVRGLLIRRVRLTQQTGQGFFVSGGKDDRTGPSLIGQGFGLDRSKSARTMLEKKEKEKK